MGSCEVKSSRSPGFIQQRKIHKSNERMIMPILNLVAHTTMHQEVAKQKVKGQGQLYCILGKGTTIANCQPQHLT